MKPKKKPKTQKVYNYVNYEDLALNIETSNEIDYQEYEENIRELEKEIEVKENIRELEKEIEVKGNIKIIRKF